MAEVVESRTLKNLSRIAPDSEVVRLEELSASDRSRVDRICKALFPGSIVYGVLETARTRSSISGELRPILAQARQPFPFLVRFVGPEVMLVPDVAMGLERALADILEHFGPKHFFWSLGHFDGQLYYVRSYFPHTLSQIVARYDFIEIYDLVSVISKIAGEVENWHRNGFFHAHLSVENIFIDEAGDVFLLDGMIFGATCAALSRLGNQKMLSEIDPKSFAPEVLEGHVGMDADLFALGQIISQLLPYSVVKGSIAPGCGRPEGVVSRLEALSSRLSNRLPEKRPRVAEVKVELDEILKEIQVLSEDEKSSSRRPTERQADRPGRSDSASAERPVPSNATSRDVPKVEQRAPLTKRDPLTKGEDQNATRSSSRGKVVNVGGGQKPRSDYLAPTTETKSRLRNSEEVFYSPDSKQAELSPSRATSTRPDSSTAREPEWLKERRRGGGNHEHPRREEAELNKTAGVSPRTNQTGGGHVVGQGAGGTGHNRPLEDEKEQRSKSSASMHSSRNKLAAGHIAHPVGDLRDDYPSSEASYEDDKSVPNASESKSRKLMSAAIGVVLVALFVFICGTLYLRFAEDSVGEYSAAELTEMWWSQIRSRSDKVVRVALTPENSLSETAQSLIFESALQGKKSASPIDSALIRVALDNRWEASLSKQDRQAVLIYATLQVSQEFHNFAQPGVQGHLHPAVILALVAVIGEREQASLTAFPASVLTGLPPPAGAVFQSLLDIQPNLNCGSREIRLLADIVASGPSRADPIFEFLSEDTVRRLLVLSKLYLSDEKLAGDFLHTTLNHPNQRLGTEAAVWATKRRLIAWSDLSNSDKLRILSGVVPAAPIGPKIIASLFEHPSPDIRGYSVARSLNEIKFAHPAAVSVLGALAREPSLLGPSQTIFLAQLLQNPNQDDRGRLKKWLEANPAESLLVEMLLATSKEKHWTSLDREISIHLRENKWKPMKEQLIYLVVHPEPLTRLYAYSQVYLLEDKAFALKVLTEARKREVEADFKQVLDLNITQLSKMQTGKGVASGSR